MLDRFRQIHLLNILGIVWIQLISGKRTSFVDALLAPKSNDRTRSFADAPRGGNTRHAHTAFLSYFFNKGNDCLVSFALARADHVPEMGVGLLAVGIS